MAKLVERMIAGVVFGVIALPVADASARICETLGPAIAPFNFVLADKFVVKPRATPGGVYNYGCSDWGFVGGVSCSVSAQFKHAEFDTVTATRPTGTAVRFTSSGEYECRYSQVGEIYTGGGTVTLSDDIEPDLVDTSGTDPSVAGCRDAIAAMSSASAAFLAMPPVRSYDKVRARPGETAEIDARGGGVVNVGEIKLDGAPIRPYEGYRYGTCYFEDGGALIIHSDPDDEVVINVDHLDLGNCSDISTDAGGLLFNVPGRGRKVRIGIQALEAAQDLPEILAPERVVAVRGGRTEASTPLAGLYARKLISLGYVFFEEDYCEAPD